jgi:hypothetical protein
LQGILNAKSTVLFFSFIPQLLPFSLHQVFCTLSQSSLLLRLVSHSAGDEPHF